VKRIAFGVVGLVAISVFVTNVVGTALTLPRAIRRKSSTHLLSRLLAPATILSCLTFLLFFYSAALAQSQQPLDQPPGEFSLPDAPEPSPRTGGQSQQQKYGTVSGRVVDETGTGVAGAEVKPMRDQESVIQEVQSDDGAIRFCPRISRVASAHHRRGRIRHTSNFEYPAFR
jgi:hypothetical protein